jgi:hypothetical protein
MVVAMCDGDQVLHEFFTSQRAQLIDQCNQCMSEAVRATSYASAPWRSLRQRPTRALPAPRARDGKASLGLARDIRFDYFKVLNILAHVSRTRKDSQIVTKAMFRWVGSQGSRA